MDRCFVKTPPCHFSRRTIEADSMPVNPCRCLGWMQLESCEVAGAASPVELVFFIAVQEVVFGGPVCDSRLDRERHGGGANAVLPVSRIETRLIKIEGRPILQTIKGGGRYRVQPHDQQTEPTAIRGQLHKLSMKCDHGIRLECFGTTINPAFLVQVYDDIQCVAGFGRCPCAFDAHVERTRKIS